MPLAHTHYPKSPRKLKPGGYALNKATIYRLMMRQFYYGEMEIKGVLYQHCYPPIISQELFKACEDVRLG
jgi:hypothetical protein